MCHRDGAMATVHVRRAKPPGLPHGKVRTAAQLLQNPDMLAHLSVFDATGEDTADSDDIHRPNTSQRFVFLNARERMAPTVDMFIGPTTGTPIFAFGSPFRDANG